MSERPTPTEAQEKARSTLGQNLLVNAGAGSGKTWVLVERFIHLLSHPDESGITSASQIVAITFTTKAAQEMRARIRDRLNARLAEAVDADERLCWARHLKEMDSARISTIHALAVSLLRANAADLDGGLDPAFEVLDEVQSRLLADAAVDDVLRETPSNDPALAVFADFTADDVLNELRAAVFKPLPPLADDLLAHWAAAQAALWERMQPHVLETLRAELGAPPPVHVPADDKRAQTWQECAAALSELSEPTTNWSPLQRLALVTLKGGSKKAWGEDDFNEAGQRLGRVRDKAKDALTWLGEPVDATPDGPDARSAALVNCWHTLIGRVQVHYEALKAARGALDFDDLERLALVLLEKPAVARRYDGVEFRHVMVDEFQDTSETQWAIIRRLANPARPGALFLVGDPKQSIYAFRGADARVFDRARETIVGQGGAVIALARSFRTHRALVEQFNAWFGHLLVRDMASPAAAFQTTFGADDVMDAQRETDPALLPALEILLADKSDAADAEDSGRAREAQAIAARIQALIADGCGYEDMALLFRATSAMPIYEEALKDAGIPYVTVGGRGYYDRQEVWDVLALLRAVYQRDDTLNLATALRSPMFALSDDALLALRWPGEDGKTPDVWDALAEAGAGALPGFPAAEIEAAAWASHTLSALRESAGRVSLAELIERSLAETGYRAVLSALPDGARRRGNLDKLVSKAADAGSLSLGAFLQLLGDLTERETRESEAVVDVTGAVRLMTIHAAKGLEFPVVFVADAARDSRGHTPAQRLDEVAGLVARLPKVGQGNEPVQSFAWRMAAQIDAARQDAELRRLLYVAATRAKDRLIISAAVKPKTDGTLGKLPGLCGLVAATPGFDTLFAAAVSGTTDGEWCNGPARCAFVQQPRVRTGEEVLALWPEALATSLQPPALLGLTPVDHWAVARSLSATAVADLGRARLTGDEAQIEQLRQRWRGQMLHGAPDAIGAVAPAQDTNLFARRLGDAVHRALRWHRPGMSDADLRAMLESLLWEDGLLPETRDVVLLERALDLTRKVLTSDIETSVAAARQVYRELPFAWHTGVRAIYGVIDVLFETAEGAWALADYKTARLLDATDAGLRRHAAQYHFQLAVYAAAARDVLALPDLSVYIHYIQHQRTILLSRAELDEALHQLEGTIGAMMVEDAPG